MEPNYNQNNVTQTDFNNQQNFNQQNMAYNQNPQYVDPKYAKNVEENNKGTRVAFIVALIIIILTVGCCCIGSGILGFGIFKIGQEATEEVENDIDYEDDDIYVTIPEEDLYDYEEDYIYEDEEYVSEDYTYQDLSGVIWESETDGYWSFIDDEICYLNSDDGSYFRVNYKVTYDEDAVSYIVDELSEYAVTEEEQERVLDNTADYEHYICIDFYNVEYYENGELVGSDYGRAPYFGFMFDNGDTYTYELVGMNSANVSAFIEYK